MLVCSNIDSQVHTLSQLCLWVNTLWLEGGGESKAAGLERGCKYLPDPAIVNGVGA